MKRTVAIRIMLALPDLGKSLKQLGAHRKTKRARVGRLCNRCTYFVTQVCCIKLRSASMAADVCYPMMRAIRGCSA